MNKYIFAKIDRGNRLADVYLQGKGEVDFPAIPIYFECEHDNEADFLKFGGAKGQGELFFECGRNCAGKFIVVIYEGKIHFLQPSGSVVFRKSTIKEKENCDGWIKLLPVELLTSISIAEVPAVLAGIGANRYYSSGTFREISDSGNILAIKVMLGQKIDIPTSPSITHAIECLGSVEFETLIAKLFEEAGCFVPAYRGGNMQGVDLFVHNKSHRDIFLGRVGLHSGERKSIQVKLASKIKTPPPGIDLLVAGNVEESADTLGVEWLKSTLQQCTSTREWLFASLEWLPQSYLNALRQV